MLSFHFLQDDMYVVAVLLLIYKLLYWELNSNSSVLLRKKIFWLSVSK
jgi:hypothetical protein